MGIPIGWSHITGTVRAWLHALVGTVLVVIAAAIGVLPAARIHVGANPGVTLLVVSLAVLLVAGLPGPSREASVRVANRLLRTDMPVPARTRWPDRLRTGLWLVAHAAIGGALVTLTCSLLIAAGTFPVVWLGGGGRVDILAGSVDVAPGWQGVWTLPVAALCLAVAATTTALVAVGLRALARFLLGPGRSERLAALEERVSRLARRDRLARDLHDSIGHTLTATTIHAAVARELIDRDPEGARLALQRIEESSRTAVDELDHVLGTLREEAVPTAPEPALADVPALVEHVRQTGTEVRAEVIGDLARVPAAVSREAYRIVQEGLTNALKHAAGAPVTVRVAVVGDRLELEVVNPLAGRGLVRAGAGRRGRGLAGISERATLLRGDVSAGPDGASWRLTARLPIPPPPP